MGITDSDARQSALVFSLGTALVNVARSAVAFSLTDSLKRGIGVRYARAIAFSPFRNVAQRGGAELSNAFLQGNDGASAVINCIFLSGIPVFLEAIAVFWMTWNAVGLFYSATMVVIVISSSLYIVLTSGWLARVHNDYEQKTSDFHTVLDDIASNAETIHCFGVQRFIHDKATRSSFAIKHASKGLMTVSCVHGLIYHLIYLCGFSVLAAAAYTDFESGQITVGALVALVIIQFRMSSASQVLIDTTSLMINGLVKLERFSDIIFHDDEGEISDRLPISVRSIAMTNVCFRYNEKSILYNVNISFGIGENIAIIGASGVGKTTLARVLSGLIEPTSGRIAFDGVGIDASCQGFLGRVILLVPQDVQIFSATLEENILLGCEADPERMAGVTAAAALTSVVADLDGGLSAVLGQRGHEFSGGERQRIGLARALVREPAVLILDETMAAWDKATEREVLERIMRLRSGKSTMLITHRLESLEGFDRVLIVEGGHVREQKTSRISYPVPEGQLAESAEQT